MTTQQDKPGARSHPNSAASALLPYSLLKKIQEYLCQEKTFHDDTKLFLSLSDRDTIKRRPHLPYSGVPSTLSQPPSASSNALAYLHDLGCRRYNESEIVQIQIVDQPTRFCSSLNGKLVYEIKSPSSAPNVDFLYAIRVLHCMDNTPGFAKLVGIVTDDSQKHLKSYLLEVPGVCYSLLQAAAFPGIQWERREKWAFQLIKAISQLHSQGFVVGGVTARSIPLIDNEDSVQLWTFKERFLAGRLMGTYYPPEFHYVRNMSSGISEADCPRVTSKADIFQLGLMLWLLAENGPATYENPVCRRSGCNASHITDTVYDLSHAEPVALPTLSESIPKYFRDIVDACRRANPSERPAARELLEMFPFSIGSRQVQDKLPKLTNEDVSMMFKGMRGTRISCDRCAKSHIQLPYFRCTICDFADFYLCQTCYDGGLHCRDDSHLLVEMGTMGSWTIPKRYHSSVRISGDRDSIDM